MNAEEIAAMLHRAAERIPAEAGTPAMDALARAGSIFIAESTLTDEFLTPFVIADPRALGYGVMLGWLAREGYGVEALREIAREADAYIAQSRSNLFTPRWVRDRARAGIPASEGNGK